MLEAAAQVALKSFTLLDSLLFPLRRQPEHHSVSFIHQTVVISHHKAQAVLSAGPLVVKQPASSHGARLPEFESLLHLGNIGQFT